MISKRTANLAFATICFFSRALWATNCSNLPTHFTGNEFPTGDFFSNFNNSCYTIPLSEGYGSESLGDLNSLYHKVFYKIDPRYELVIVGAFPHARYFSIAVNDEHTGIAQSILDVEIPPLNAQYVNPFQPGVAFVAGQRYALRVAFGGTPGPLETGCKMTGYSVKSLDATLRHQGSDWNSDAGFFLEYPNTPLHVVDNPSHTNPNTAGTIMIREYLYMSPEDPLRTNPYVIVREVSSGCAYPAAFALNNLQVVTNTEAVGNTWLDTTQINTHKEYQNDYLPQYCYATDSNNKLVWIRNGEYVPGPNPYSSYAFAAVPAGLPTKLAAAGDVMRFRFRIPKIPPTPCTNGCSRSGLEELRYMSLSFLGTVTLASIADRDFVQDGNGYVTLIVTTGPRLPGWVLAANGYTVLELSAIEGYADLNQLLFRNIITANTFACSSYNIPISTSENTPAGGLMGEYIPVVDYPMASSLPMKAAPLVQANTCLIYPAGSPGVWPNCGSF